MSYSSKLRDWAGDSGRLHERVMPDGRHHVWLSLSPGWRIDRLDRDFERACQLVWELARHLRLHSKKVILHP